MNSFQDLISAGNNMIDSLIFVFVALALLVFFWGLVKFITKAGDEKSVEEGRNTMVWGLIALFVMISVWGIVNLMGSELGIDNLQSIPE